jgi:hypothetical protein
MSYAACKSKKSKRRNIANDEKIMSIIHDAENSSIDVETGNQ